MTTVLGLRRFGGDVKSICAKFSHRPRSDEPDCGSSQDSESLERSCPSKRIPGSSAGYGYSGLPRSTVPYRVLGFEVQRTLLHLNINDQSRDIDRPRSLPRWYIEAPLSHRTFGRSPMRPCFSSKMPLPRAAGSATLRCKWRSLVPLGWESSRSEGRRSAIALATRSLDGPFAVLSAIAACVQNATRTGFSNVPHVWGRFVCVSSVRRIISKVISSALVSPLRGVFLSISPLAARARLILIVIIQQARDASFTPLFLSSLNFEAEPSSFVFLFRIWQQAYRGEA